MAALFTNKDKHFEIAEFGNESSSPQVITKKIEPKLLYMLDPQKLSGTLKCTVMRILGPPK